MLRRKLLFFLATLKSFVIRVFSGAVPLTISNALAGNADSYEISGDSKQSILPTGYTQLEYIESNGSQYIDTGISPAGKKIGAVIDFQFTDTSRTTGGVFGSNKTDGTDNCQFTVYNSKWRIKINNYATYGATYDTDRHIARCNMPNGTSIDDTVYTTTQYTIASNNTNNVFVGACNYGNSTSSLTYTLIGKLYSAKVYDDTTLVRDFVPCKNSSNVVGMYDLVSNTFFTNAGTGTFTAGSELPMPTNPLGVYGVGDKTENLTSYILNATVTGNGTSGIIISSPELNVNWEENTQYTFSLDCSASGVTFSSAGNLLFFIVRYTDGSFTYQGITSDNYQQSRISFTTSASKTVDTILQIKRHARWTDGTITICNLSIVKGTTAPTSYIPYGYRIPVKVNNSVQATIYANEPLRKVGDYADVINSDGTITRNVGVKVFDGTESWIYNYGVVGLFQLAIVGSVPQSTTPYVGYCSHFCAINNKTAAAISDKECTFQGASGVNGRFAIKYEDYDNNLAGFKTWLAEQYANGTPVYVLYPLATATTESITAPTIEMSAGTNIIDTNTEVKASNVSMTVRCSQ